MQQVAVNTRFLLPGQLEGLGRFTDEVLKALVRQHPQTTFHFFFDRSYHPRFLYADNVVPHVLQPPARHPLLYLLFFELAVARKLNKLQPAVFFSPDGYLSLRHKRTPQVGVFHDLAFEHFPRDIDRFHRWHYRRYFPRFARHAARLCTVSEYSKQDIVQRYGISPAKISVVYNGSSGSFRPHSPEECRAVRQHYTGGAPYFIYVGAIQPRKNLDNLLQAFDRFKTATGHPAQLLLTGRKAWNFAEVIRTYNTMTHQQAVHFTGYVSDTELARLYSGALALTYVSRFEGFGLPILEAMHAETPVMAGNTSSMPEVAGPAGLLVDPDAVPEIAQGLTRLATDPRLRQELVARGRLQRERFSWQRTAQAVWQSLQQAAARG